MSPQLDNCPLGTKAPAFNGGAWEKTERGWRWGTNGGTFPRPGGDWTGDLVFPLSTPETEFKLLVCGGREFFNYAFVDRCLHLVHSKRPISLIVHGAAPGADTLADKWAKANRIPVIPVPANWTRLGKAAGPIRNQEMLDVHQPHGVVAFPGNEGTADMVKKSVAAGVKVWEPLSAPTLFNQ